MKVNLERVLYKAAAMTFDELGFMFVTPEEDLDTSARFQAAADIEFSGPFCGTLSVMVWGDLLETLTSNMLGDDETPSKYQQLDALGEVANVICGNVLPNIGNPRDVFRLAPPKLIESKESYGCESDHRTAQVRLPLGTGGADVSISINNLPA